MGPISLSNYILRYDHFSATSKTTINACTTSNTNRSVEKHATAHNGAAEVCRHSCCAVVHWLLSLFIAHLVGRLVSGVRVGVSFQIIPHLVGRLVSEVRVSVSFQSFAFTMLSVPSCFCHPVRVTRTCPVLSCFRQTPEWRRCVFSTDPIQTIQKLRAS